MKAEREDGYHVRDFLAFAEKQGEVTYKTVADYFRALNDKPYANSTKRTKRIKRIAVKARLRAVLADGMDFNQAAALREALAKLDREVKAPRAQAAPIGADKVIRPDELDRMLAVATKRDACLLRFLWAKGARISELTGLRLDRCESQGGVVRLRVVGKGNKERFLRIRAALFNQIRESFPGRTYLFETNGGRALSRVNISSRIHKLAQDRRGFFF
jgi:site-specific recombinase XerD